jgi:hypothetical protein
MGNTALTRFPYAVSDFSVLPSAAARGEGLMYSSKHPHVYLKQIHSTLSLNQLGIQGFPYLEKKVSMLPDGIRRALLVDKQDVSGGKRVNAVFEVGAYTLGDAISHGKLKQGEETFWTILSFLVNIGKEMESQFEYHPEVNLQTITIDQGGKLKLNNPYMNADYAREMLEVNCFS